MNIGVAIAIFSQIDNKKYSDDEKALAIYEVLQMPTHNSINKATLVRVAKWLFDKAYEIEGNEG